MRPSTVLSCCVALASLFAAAPAAAQIVLVPGTLNMFRDNRGANNVGVTSGDRLQYGADVVGGSLNVTLGARSATGFVSTAGPCGPLAVNAGFCANATAYNAARLDPWQFTFTRGAESLLVMGPSVTGAAGNPIPFPTSVTLSGTGLTPTISWQLQPGFSADAFRINIFDRDRLRSGTGAADIIYSTAIAANATSFTLPAGIGLSASGDYAINFQVIETRDHGPLVNNNNSNILSRSNSYFNFAPLTGNVPHDVALPTIGANGVYNFSVGGVGADHITFIDPLVAVGYRYLTAAGDPNFRSVLLPNVGDGLYTLTFADAAGMHSVDVLHDQQFFFGSSGVSDFTVTGIETDAGLDPSNPTAFITGLTFAANGSFTGTMTPLTADVIGVVPEPETYALLLAGLAAMAALGRRRSRRIRESGSAAHDTRSFSEWS